ncbi:MAG TPA: discoidin domain-containing protein, partial [Candidatus Polarisedimenticolia bacterium]|nr:discoidin domain-containing protein [Candidatus Polarisedimenticolia bacterium]
MKKILLLTAILICCCAAAMARGPATDSLENIALHRAAYQSDSVDDDHTGHLVTDGSEETFWENHPSSNSWIMLDLGEVCSFQRVVLKWGEARPARGRIQISSDKARSKVWQDVSAFTNSEEAREIDFSPRKARYVRLAIPSDAASARGCVLSEFEVYGTRKTHFTPSPQPKAGADGSLLLTGGHWKLCSAMFVRGEPEEISRRGFDDAKWIPAIVPGTVLGSYLAIGAIPDPWFGDQMSQISEDFFSCHDFWYRDEFVVPKKDAGRRLWLNFDGINWKADVFFNGAKVGGIAGAFIRGRFDVTEMAKPGATNCVAVLIHHVAHPVPGPKKVKHKTLGAPTTNGDLLGHDSPTFLSSAGWNWVPIIRGRDIGIWNDVRLETSGDVTVVDPWVATDSLSPDHAHAEITVRTELKNHSRSPESGKLIATIGDLKFETNITLAANETQMVTLNKTNWPGLALDHPRLWWPNDYGEQPLYRLNLRFEEAGRISDQKSVNFGVRKLESRVMNNVLTLFVNDTRILCRGGNWGMAEGMLNCDAAGLDLRVRLHHDANLNMIRNWVGMEGHQAFYDACDRYGILIWDDFWLANPVDGPDPDDHKMFMNNARDKIRRVRSHPSLALYCGRNEGMAPPDLDAAMREAVNSLDGTRYYLPHSAAGAVTGYGPYVVQDVDWYFANRGKTFHSELGIVAIPTIESMKAMMPAEDLWPISDMWAVHDYQKPRSQLFTKRVSQRYGQPSNLEDYCREAQMVNLESAKAMYECLQANQGGGVLVWMTQSAWPSLICQLYDNFFEMTAAYFGAKSGCEPAHIFWDANADVIKTANNTQTNLDGLTAEARLYSLDGKELWRKSVPLDLAETSVKDCFPITRPTKKSTVFFVKLILRQGGQTISDNFYWGCAKGGTCQALNQLPAVELSAKAAQSDHKGNRRLSVRVTNPTQKV